MRLLVIEDSAELRQPLVAGLGRSGYAVDEAVDGKTGLWMAQSAAYDLIVLDLMLPKLDGLSLLKQLRATDSTASTTRVLALTAKDSVDDRITGLKTGADDYLIKPFSFDELVARIEALLRRERRIASAEIQIEGLRIDTRSRSVWRDQETINLTPREYAILEFLVRSRGRVISRAQIEERVYDGSVELMSNVVDSAVCALRRKIDLPDQPSLIQTRRGAGYLIAATE